VPFEQDENYSNGLISYYFFCDIPSKEITPFRRLGRQWALVAGRPHGGCLTFLVGKGLETVEVR
jgi:hypothetical protein